MKFTDFKRFRRDEDGAITAFILLMFLLMVVAGGMAIDFMRHEAERVRLQDAIDRGVLSATSFEQLDSDGVEYNTPQSVVESYLAAEGYDINDPAFVLAVNPDPANSRSQRRIDAGAIYDINTFFLRLINIPTLTVAAVSSAETQYSNLELSLVLDVSGSMTWPASGPGGSGPARMESLRSAANIFIDAIVTPENLDKTTVSIIPFSANTNPGELLVSQIPGYDRWHNYSSCFEFDRTPGEDFSTTALSLDPSAGYIQSQHIALSADNNDPRRFWCPRAANAITLPTNDVNVLKSAIAAMKNELYTASWQGMKWGAALLDPSLKPVFQTLSTTMINRPIYNTNGTVALNGDGSVQMQSVPAIDPLFANRPANFDGSTQKYIVLMSDGDNTLHSRARPSDYNVMGTENWRTQANADYWNYSWNNVDVGSSGPVDGFPVLTRTDRVCTGPRWNRVCTNVNVDYQVLPNTSPNALPTIPSNRDYAWEIDNAPGCGYNCTNYDGEGDVILQEICQAAKDNDIVVYTIGFAIKKPSWITSTTVVTLDQAIALDHDDYAAYSELYQCASDGSKFYHAANETELSQAFAEIASSIAHLKLIATE